MRAGLLGAHDGALDIVFLCNRLELFHKAADKVCRTLSGEAL
jgi:hypothetical protein